MSPRPTPYDRQLEADIARLREEAPAPRYAVIEHSRKRSRNAVVSATWYRPTLDEAASFAREKRATAKRCALDVGRVEVRAAGAEVRS